jgi:hypothetical protein
MSRQLPTRPNLEYLRKQAKELLAELHTVDPSVQLSDAQHELAREYGFSSWPRLKAHVERLAEESAGVRSPFAGRWSANLARSRRHPDNEFRSATILFEVNGDDVRLTDVVVDGSGRDERHVNAIRVDGVEHVSDSANGYSLLAKWRGPRILEAVAKKDGQLVGVTRYEVSADDQTLTISADQLLIVLDRADSETRV